MSQKAGDERTVPICHIHHLELHRIGEKTFWVKYDFTLSQVEQIAKNLWEKFNEDRS